MPETATSPEIRPRGAAQTPPPAAEFSDDIYRAMFRSNLPREHGFEPLRVEGTLPAELRGTLFRAGPGLFELFGKRYTHLFESDGAISAVKVDGGQAYGATRVIESAALARERRAGRMLYGFNVPYLRRVRNAFKREFKNTGNTNVIGYQGKLYALMEAARPTELSPGDLTTIGETNLDGVVRGAFSAHPHYVASRNTIYNFGQRYGRHTVIDLYALPLDGAPQHLGSVPLDRPMMLHDFICTDNHLLFFVSPVKVKVLNVLLQLGTFTDMFEWTPRDGIEVIVVPIDRPDEVVRFHSDAFYQWHYANAFERDGALVVDYARYPNFDSFEALETSAIPSGQFYRTVVDTQRRRLESEPLSNLGCEFPRVHPRFEGGDYRYAWMMSTQPHGLARLDVTTGEHELYELPAQHYSSEPVFAATGNHELDGYLLSLVYDHDAKASHLAVFHAKHLSKGPIAKAWFDHHIPITFHGNWMGR